MHNHIEIKFKNIATPGLVIGHNQQLLADKFLNSTFIVDIDHCIEKNTFWILGQCEITCLTMFGLGSEKLKYLGSQIDPNTKQEYNTHQVSPDNRWQLHYDFPVFAWLHKTLHFGWLIERY